MSTPEQFQESVSYLRDQGVPQNPEAAIILGSGLGDFGQRIEEALSVDYSLVPHFPVTSVEGHAGQLIAGKINGHSVIAFSGRFHHYEGFTFEQTAIPVYIAKALGAKKLIISNAAGAINTDFNVGDLMIIDSVMRQNFGISPRGNDQHRYNHYPFAEKTRQLAAELAMPVQRGTYVYVTGPNYETKAEIRAFRRMGADAVGMSTAPELFEAARLSLKSVAISLISNMASGVTQAKLNHEEVKIAAESRKEDFARLVSKLVEEL